MPEERLVGEWWEGGSCSGGVRPIPSSKDGMGDSSPNNCGVGGEGSGVGTTRRVATGRRSVGAVLVLGFFVVLGL